MKITFLGTGTSQGVPFIGCGCAVCASTSKYDKRLRTSIFVEYNGFSFVIDTGPDFRQQMLANNIKHIDFVLFTHSHKDHIAGLDDIKAYNIHQKSKLDIYGNLETINRIKTEFDYVFAEQKYPGIPELTTNVINDATMLEFGALSIQPILVQHHKMDVFGYRIGDFTYITDANFISDLELEKIKGSKILVLNALRHEKHISHFTLSEAVEIATKLEIPEVYFTHISHQLGFHNDIDSTLPSHMHLAYDGLTIAL